MNKIQLIVSDCDYVSLTQPWISDIVHEYFNIVYIENNPTINKNDLFVTNSLNTNVSWYQKFINSGCKLIVDNLWEMSSSQKLTNALYLNNKNWFWYNESLWYTHLGYHTHVPNVNISKNGLLLMNLKKPHRDWLFERLDLTKLLYSYVENNIFINGDINRNDNPWQRYFNPDWYNSTAFSIVAETTVCVNNALFITEKTFKPIAFQHPFILFGQPGILHYLKSQGFETFENIFDETYDKILEVEERLHKIVNQINNYTHKNYDSTTLSKLKHNVDLFFNHNLVKDRIKKEIVEPIIEYAET